MKSLRSFRNAVRNYADEARELLTSDIRDIPYLITESRLVGSMVDAWYSAILAAEDLYEAAVDKGLALACRTKTGRNLAIGLSLSLPRSMGKTLPENTLGAELTEKDNSTFYGDGSPISGPLVDLGSSPLIDKEVPPFMPFVQWDIDIAPYGPKFKPYNEIVVPESASLGTWSLMPGGANIHPEVLRRLNEDLKTVRGESPESDVEEKIRRIYGDDLGGDKE
jgi:hypothetical protein